MKKKRKSAKRKAQGAGLEEAGPAKGMNMKAGINGQSFPTGAGQNQQEPGQKAAKNALTSLSEKENQKPVTENVAENPTAAVHQNSITKPQCVHRLSEYGQKNKPTLTSNNATPSSRVMADHQKYPTVPGKTKRAKKQAAKRRCDDPETTQVSSCSAVSEDTETRLSTSLTRLEVSDAESNVVTTTTRTSDSVVFGSSSNHPKIQAPEAMDTGNSTSETALTQSGRSYKLEFDSFEIIGKGAFGLVVKARHKLLDNCYAIKIVPCKMKEKDLREVKALSELSHCNIVRLFSCWTEDTGHEGDGSEESWSSSQSSSSSSSCAQFLYIQMELCDTKTLRVWIDEMNAESVRKDKRRKESLTIVQQIVSGVEYIHSKMFIHRDLKPANILFGQDKKVKIGDFGLVTTENDHNDENRMERTAYKGTPSYMAPEQKSEKTYDQKVDIYAVGLIYFELLWKIPTVCEKQAIWGDARRQTFPKGFPQDFYKEYTIIKSMLSVKPEDRPEASKLMVHLKEFNTERRGSRTV